MIDVNRPITAFVLALASVILTPVLLFIEITTLIFAAKVTHEPANPIWVKVIVVVVAVHVYLILVTIGQCSLEGC